VTQQRLHKHQHTEATESNLQTMNTQQWIDVKTYLQGVAKASVVYDITSNCLTSTYKPTENNYYILALQQDQLTNFSLLQAPHHKSMTCALVDNHTHSLPSVKTTNFMLSFIIKSLFSYKQVYSFSRRVAFLH